MDFHPFSKKAGIYAGFFFKYCFYRFTMRLSQIQTLKLLSEADELPPTGDETSDGSTSSKEPEVTGTELEGIWNDNSDSSVAYRPTESFSVKQIGDEYELSKVESDRRTIISKLSKDELDQKYVVSTDATPDAEGYVSYSLRDNVEALQYSGDSKIIHNGSDHATLMKGDYIVKKPKGDSFEYMVVHQSEFESKYSEAV